MRTVVLLRRCQLRFRMKRRNDGYDTRQPRTSRNSRMRVICSRSPVSHWKIWSAHGSSRSCRGVSTCRGPTWPIAAVVEYREVV